MWKIINRNNTNSKAFSLIELLIVIAIIGIIAAVAVPAYNGYSIRAKINAVLPILVGLGEQSEAYSVAHGFYPNAEQLGVGTGTIANNSQVGPDAAFVVIEGDSCGGAQRITYYVNPSDIDDKYTTVLLEYFLYHINGTVVVYKAYSLSGASFTETGEFLSGGWLNINNPDDNASTINGNLENTYTCP